MPSIDDLPRGIDARISRDRAIPSSGDFTYQLRMRVGYIPMLILSLGRVNDQSQCVVNKRMGSIEGYTGS